ncbi:phosphatidate cytidylyltransferase, mitochondrial [Toxorhynchites rutilus septentrionalis]|uniref:phosphatidate cytidylyltransferase, mitochondrial n=1 Tax=Toxorhynchites rutilus septentrionalis TaxID=329112 RepID=UPI00247834AC|nr:phosphatidate cytidylyltransferase, mitochondrial [Toxorhynchites rutilus septentrionalis]
MLTKGNTSPMFYRILARFPSNFTFCFAYGSGVKQQIGYDSSKKKTNMIDLIYTVDNVHRWHASNLDRNPDHYSGLRVLGSNFIARYQETLGAKVFFNTLIPIKEEDVVIKYGVISTKDLIEDLTDWTHLYLAGRLHKPVEIIRTASNSKIQNAIECNLKSAVHAALLLLPEQFTEFELYRAISNLSYAGDFRMIFGENKDKVNNIVRPQLEGFRSLYASTLKELSPVLHLPSKTSDNSVCTQDQSNKTILYHLSRLPKWPVRVIVHKKTRGRYRQDTEDILTAISKSSDYQDTVFRCLRSIVWQSSVKQSIKNIPSAGVIKSIKYSFAKALKTFST